MMSVCLINKLIRSSYCLVPSFGALHHYEVVAVPASAREVVEASSEIPISER